MSFKFEIIGEYVSENDNVDVEIELENGSKYAATFFTISNIHRMFEKNRKSGECLNGTYFWASDMVIVEKIDEATIEATIKQMIEDEELDQAFQKI